MVKLIGRKKEQDRIEAVLRASGHVLLEGAVGVGKTTLAISVAEHLGRPLVRVDGDGRYTEAKLVGAFDPKLVLEKGFDRESFIPGPLFRAMENGEILLINELNRMPEMVQNVLLPALDERKIQIPVLGELRAQPGFAVIATQNPREFVATSSLSEALLDRLEWIGIDPLTGEEEIEIVRAHLNRGLPEEFIRESVELVRLTRAHPKVKRGASVRAAISLARVLEASPDCDFKLAAMSALANRIELQSGKFSARPYSESLEEVVLELLAAVKKKP